MRIALLRQEAHQARADAKVRLAWWPYEVPEPPLLDVAFALDQPPFRSWALCMAEAVRHRGNVHILVPEADALKIPTGRWDMTGIVLVNVGP